MGSKQRSNGDVHETSSGIDQGVRTHDGHGAVCDSQQVGGGNSPDGSGEMGVVSRLVSG
jgi:hypothetical protein